jgi:hypothetical protein
MMRLDGLQIVGVNLNLMQSDNRSELIQLTVQQLDYRFSPTIARIAFKLTRLPQLFTFNPLVLRNQPMQ